MDYYEEKVSLNWKISGFCHGVDVFAVMGYYSMWVGQELKTTLLLKMDQQPIPKVTDSRPVLHNTPEEWRPNVKSLNSFSYCFTRSNVRRDWEPIKFGECLHHSVWSVFSSHFLSKNTIYKVYKTEILFCFLWAWNLVSDLKGRT